MQIKLLHATENPVELCGLAAMVCRDPQEVCRIAKERESGICIKYKRFCDLMEICRESGHMSIFEHISYTFLIDGISRACSHQLVRHRLASYTQASQRHTNPGDGVMPQGLDAFRADIWINAMRDAYQYYATLLSLGTAKEDARFVLPNAVATTLIMTMNARELFNFLTLRLCKKAQWEIRQLAEQIHEIAKRHFPELFDYCGPNCTQPGGCREAKPCEKGNNDGR